ncbi:hypothetical protein [Bradyrhizobium sp. HKCCYLR20261]|uniref:hypothetical protein n=1 Tax=Bradyrhizobium sp. HKCCYLR20261 TaxID=3420760 RepID=UPI003EB9DBE5
MSTVVRIAALALASIVVAGLPEPGAARGLYPLTECGPDLSQLCRLSGTFEATPFHYNLAIYPGCIRRVAVRTPRGVQVRRVVVCGAPDRPMVW